MRPVTKEAIKLFQEGTVALSEMAHNGIRVDTKYLDRTIVKVGKEIEDLTHQLHSTKFWRRWQRKYRHKAKLGSLDQLATIVFVDMKYPCYERTNTGRPKADEKAFEVVDIPFVQKFSRLRKLLKVKGTYLEGIRRETVNGFVHPIANLNKARSLRSSFDHPNFQNMPIRNPEMGHIVRRSVIARKRRRIIERDLSGVEVRVNGMNSQDPTLKKYLTGHGDMHGDMAGEIFMLPPHKVWKKTTRDGAKNMFVFSEFYGNVYFQEAPIIWDAMERRNFRVGENGINIREHLRRKGIHKLGNCDGDYIRQHGTKKGTFVHHLKEVATDFWNERFKVHKQWREEVYQKYLRKGHVDHMFTGFACDEILRRNQVFNWYVQGPAYHIQLKAQIETQRRIHKYKMKSLIVATIHDSIIGDVPNNEVQDYLNITEEVIIDWLPKQWSWINIPLEAEAELTEVDGNWAEKTQWVKGKDWGPKTAAA